MARDRPSPYDEGGPSAAAAPRGAPPYCIETRRSLLPKKRNRSKSHETILTTTSYETTSTLLPMSTKKLEVSTLFLRHAYFRMFCVVRMPKTGASTRFVNENLDHPPVPSFPSRAASVSSLRQTRSPRPRICRSQRLLQSRERSLAGHHRCPTEAESPRLPRV